jgi:hypothetical protein
MLGEGRSHRVEELSQILKVTGEEPMLDGLESAGHGGAVVAVADDAVQLVQVSSLLHESRPQQREERVGLCQIKHR